MLNQLEDMAAALGMYFAYGSLDDMEEFARTQSLGDARSQPSAFLLFHEGYFLADLNQDGQGALEYRHQLILDILSPSILTDSPQTKRQRLDGLDLQMRRTYKALTKLGQVKGARAKMGLNLTSTNLDAIQLTLTLQPDAVSLCKL